MDNLSEDLKIAIEATIKAAEIIKSGYGNIKEVVEKKSHGVVTEIDKKSEEAIIEILQKNSSFPILAEETRNNGVQSDTYWIVDPLDGTTNYSRGIPFFGISIALMKKSEIKLGVVNNPITDHLFFGETGFGAFLNNSPINVSKQTLKTDSTVFVNYGYAQEDKLINAAVTQRLVAVCTLRKFGTTALELCFVANGSAEAFLSSGNELWDYAAGIAIVKAAGGKIIDWKGKDYDNSSSFILATNGLVDNEILEKISDLQAS